MKVQFKIKGYPEMNQCNDTGIYTVPAITATSYILPKKGVTEITLHEDNKKSV